MDWVGDVTHATPAAADFFSAYQERKSAKDVAATMAFFSSDRLTYVDAVLGWSFDHAALTGIFAGYVPRWADGVSYATKILGNERSALLFVRDTAELFGSELLIIGAVEVEAGRITRWTDYWDGRNAPGTRAQKVPDDQFPAGFGEEITPSGAGGHILDVATALAAAFAAGDDVAAAAMFTADASLEDMTLRTRIRSRSAITRYLRRSLSALPYGAASATRRITGGDTGGGYEWTSGSPASRGIVALELDSAGLISGFTAVWDGTLVDDTTLAAWAGLSREV